MRQDPKVSDFNANVSSIQTRALTEPPAARIGWTTLEELREVALTVGCTEEQIAEAINAAKRDPCKVATILHRHCLHSYLQSKQEVAA
jgi:hypothetical protein